MLEVEAFWEGSSSAARIKIGMMVSEKNYRFLLASTYSPLVPIIGLETIGSDCFHHSLSLNRTLCNIGEKKLPPGVDVIHDEENDLYLAHFNNFSSKASSSLGASQPSVGVMKMALERTGGIKSISVPDELSMSTLALFASKSLVIGDWNTI